jgi:hypothetical protein
MKQSNMKNWEKEFLNRFPETYSTWYPDCPEKYLYNLEQKEKARQRNTEKIKFIKNLIEQAKKEILEKVKMTIYKTHRKFGFFNGCDVEIENIIQAIDKLKNKKINGRK